MKSFLFVFGFFLSVSWASAQRAKPVIGKRIKKAQISQNEYTLTIKQIADELTSGVSDPYVKAYRLYTWVATKLAYDYELRTNKQLQQELFSSRRKLTEAALERNKTVCAGYAYLFEDLCKAAGVEVVTINGFTKKLVPTNAIRTKVHHTWNAIKINDSWQFVDITWARSKGESNMLNDFWFATSPQDFIKTHYPEDGRYTFLNNPPSFKHFEGVQITK